MYIWIPNTQEEMTFVEQEIISKQSEDVWIGVVDKPNGNCLFSDYKTKCPFTKYGAKGANSEDQECTRYNKKEGTGWYRGDKQCSKSYPALCEGGVK